MADDPTINDFYNAIRPLLAGRLEQYKRSIREIENRETVRGISGSFIETVLEQGAQQLQGGANEIYREHRRFARETRLSRKQLRDARDQLKAFHLMTVIASQSNAH